MSQNNWRSCYSDIRTRDELRDSVVMKLLLHGKKYAPNVRGQGHQTPAIEPPLDLSYSTGLLSAMRETDTSGSYKRCPDETALQMAAKRRCVRCDFVAEDANTSYLHYQLHRKLQSGMDWRRNYVDRHKKGELDTSGESCQDDSSTLRTLLRGHDSMQSLSCGSPSCLRSSGSALARPGYSSSGSDGRSVDSTPRSSPQLGYITGISSPASGLGSVMVHPDGRLPADPVSPRDAVGSELVRAQGRPAVSDPSPLVVPDPSPPRDWARGDEAVPDVVRPSGTRLGADPELLTSSSGDASAAPDVSSVVKREQEVDEAEEEEEKPSGEAPHPVAPTPYPKRPKVKVIQPFEVLNRRDSPSRQRWHSPLPDPEAGASVRFRAAAPEARPPERSDVSVQCHLSSETGAGGSGPCPLPDSHVMPETTARCHYCGITFDDDVMYSIHMGCHNHRHPFICNVCGKSSDNKYTFYTHIMRGHEYS